MKGYKVYLYMQIIDLQCIIILVYFIILKKKVQEIQANFTHIPYLPYLQYMIIPGNAHLQFDRVVNYKR